MTRVDPPDFERDIQTALDDMAPPADHALLARVSTEVAATPQRSRRAAWREEGWARWVAIAGVAVAATFVGILIGSSRLPSGVGNSPSPTQVPTEGPGPIGWVEPEAYRYVMSDVRCGGGERNYLGKWELTVTDGKVTVSRPLDETAASQPISNDELPTLGWIMERARAAESSSPMPVPGRPGESFVERQPPVVVIERDQFDGHPTLVRIDWMPEGVDDEECYRITRYLPYPPDLAWAEPESYAYTFDQHCGLRLLSGRFEVTVEHGEAVAFISLDGASWIDLGDMPTLADLAAQVARAYADEDANVRAFEVDPRDGHPTRIDIDWVPNAIDDEECYDITDYRITEPAGAEGPEDRYTTSVAADVTVVMSAEEVASLVTEQMSATKQAFPAEFEGVDIDILSIDAMTYGDAMRANQDLPAVPHDDGSEVGRVVWLVVADGPFATLRGLQPGPRFGTTGYYVIDDLTGQVWGMGFGP